MDLLAITTVKIVVTVHGYFVNFGQRTYESIPIFNVKNYSILKAAAPLPPNIEKGQLIGPQLTAVVAYMKGACHCSFSTIRKFLRDVVGVTISRGQLNKLVQKASAAISHLLILASCHSRESGNPHLQIGSSPDKSG